MTVSPLDNASISGRVAVDSLTGEVGQWEGVEVREHRFGGVSIHVGRREIGHLYDSRGGGWVTLPITAVSDLGSVIEILRANYERAVSRAPRA